MANQQSTVRFDHREIAVIFSLFVFVSLLMFTVGILVGKGLAQSQHGQAAVFAPGKVSSYEPSHSTETAATSAPTGTSVSTDNPVAKQTAPAAVEKESMTEHAAEHPATREVAQNTNPTVEETPSQPLKLIPEKPRTGDIRAGLQEYPKTKEVEAALRNPKLQTLYEAKTVVPESARNTASVPAAAANSKTPTSFDAGPYTVQVGSYPSEAEGNERVEALKKLGFPHAFLSATQIGGVTWYRVWLGYFPSADVARQSGEHLQARGEVKNHIVRRSDNKD
jgi:DedD protein